MRLVQKLACIWAIGIGAWVAPVVRGGSIGAEAGPGVGQGVTGVGVGAVTAGGAGPVSTAGATTQPAAVGGGTKFVLDLEAGGLRQGGAGSLTGGAVEAVPARFVTPETLLERPVIIGPTGAVTTRPSSAATSRPVAAVGP